MDSEGSGSSSRMTAAVRMPALVIVVAPPRKTPFVGLLNCRTIVSSSSSRVSPIRETATRSLTISWAAKVTVPGVIAA